MLTASNRASENVRVFAVIVAELKLWHDTKGEKRARCGVQIFHNA
jgi:hypothetical protein